MHETHTPPTFFILCYGRRHRFAEVDRSNGHRGTGRFVDRLHRATHVRSSSALGGCAGRARRSRVAYPRRRRTMSYRSSSILLAREFDFPPGWRGQLLERLMGRASSVASRRHFRDSCERRKATTNRMRPISCAPPRKWRSTTSIHWTRSRPK